MSTQSPPHPAALDPQELLTDCDVRHDRTSGPGGQHRNKVQTAVTLTHRPTGVQGAAGERRQQQMNHGVALFRLRVNLALTVRCEPADSPSAMWQDRCRSRIIHINPKHEDFPAMLAEALDGAAADQWDLKATSQRLACSTSQLIKLFKRESKALEIVNRQRVERELPPLR